MRLRRAIEFFDSHEAFRQFKKAVSGPIPPVPDNAFLRDRALKLAERLEPKGDRRELQAALMDLEIAVNTSNFHQVSAMLAFVANNLFTDVSGQVHQAIRKRIVEFDGPKFFFVGHTSYFDYVFVAQLIRRIGIAPPVVHVSGSLTKGWVSQWLQGFRSLVVPKTLSPTQHRAYSLVLGCPGRKS